MAETRRADRGRKEERAKAREDGQGTRDIPCRLFEKRAGAGTKPAEQRPGAVAATACHGERKQQSEERAGGQGKKSDGIRRGRS
jgi:hypothetical protein